MDAKEILFLLALESDLADILTLCRTKKSAKKEICDNEKFWKIKVERDYPELKGKQISEYKKLYEELKTGKVYGYEYNTYETVYTASPFTTGKERFFTISFPSTSEEMESKIEKIINKYPETRNQDLEDFTFVLNKRLPKGFIPSKVWFIDTDADWFYPILGFLSKKDAQNYLITFLKRMIESDLDVPEHRESFLIQYGTEDPKLLLEYMKGSVERYGGIEYLGEHFDIEEISRDV